MIEKSLLYIPEKVIWGAFTNTLTQMLYGTPAAEDYVTVGNLVCSGRISTFFPELAGTRYIPNIPGRYWSAENGSGKNISFAEMDTLLLTSVTSTAIEPEHMSAGAGTLHATDLVNYFYKDLNSEKIHPVCFSGYMELPDRICDMKIDAETINRIFGCSRIGGSRKRGWGRCIVEKVSLEQYENFSFLPCEGGKLLTADLEFNGQQKVYGEIRLISRREYDAEKGSGRKFASAKLFWSTGSVLYE
jgi:hypothetical protein